VKAPPGQMGIIAPDISSHGLCLFGIPAIFLVPGVE
jgi:hypothetical protein